MELIDTDADGSCAFTLGTDEKCDDGDGRTGAGNGNGAYGTNNKGKSHCKTDCSGRIKDGAEYFCGDNIIQIANDSNVSVCNASGFQCANANTTNYPGAKVNSDGTMFQFNEEECDGSNDQVKLCNKKLGLNRTSYYDTDSSKISCSSCTIKIEQNTSPCGYCGDGIWQSNEDCENTAAGIQYGAGSENVYNQKDLATSTTSSGEYTVKISGIYTIELDGAQGGDGGDGYKSEKDGSSYLPSGGSDGSGGTRVTAQYYLEKGTVLSYTLGVNGSDGTGNSSTVRRQGGSGGDGGTGYQTGNSGTSGSNGTDGSGIICPKDSGGGGGGGGAGGSSAVKIGSTVLMTAASGSGGAGGRGGSTGCYSGGSGGSGGTGVGTNTYQSGSGTGWKYYGSYGTSSTSGTGWIRITLVKYAPCIKTTSNECKFETNTSNFVDIKKRVSSCTGLIANAEWWHKDTVNQEPSGSGWTPTNEGIYSATDPGASANVCKFHCKDNYKWEDSECINQKIVYCSALSLPDENTEWNTVNFITQTWQNIGGTWKWWPEDTVDYDETPTESECRYKCKAEYTYENGHCKNKRNDIQCKYNGGNLPAHASWWKNTVNQNWTGSAWSPADNVTAENYRENNPGSGANACYFHCNKNYKWENNQCVATTNPNTCSGLPANATWWNSSTAITQTWNEDLSGCNPAADNCWTPSEIGSNQTAGAANHCYFHCNENYNYNGTTNTCDAATRTFNCAAKPDNSLTIWNTVSSYTQSWTGTAWNPADSATTHNNSATGTTEACWFKCKPNHTWSESSQKCIAKKETHSCTTPTESNWVWNTVSSIEQTWNESQQKWLPELTSTYKETASESECRYKCDSTHTRYNNACVNSRSDISCDNSTLPEHAKWWSATITQNWTSANGWKPVTSGTHSAESNTSGCYYYCPDNDTDGHFEWNGTQCVGKTTPADNPNNTCTGLPANATMWTPAKIARTWTNVNDSWQWWPSTTATYSDSAVSGECHFYCNDGYHWDDNTSSCVPNIPECSTTSATPCIDSSTGFIWSSLQPKQKWANVPSKCSALTEGGYSWRAPTIDELRTLIQGCDNTSGSGGICRLSDPDCLCYSAGANYCQSATCGYVYNDCRSCTTGSSILGDTVELWSSSKQIYSSDTYAWGVNFASHGTILDGGRSNEYQFRCIAVSCDKMSLNDAAVYLKLDEGTGTKTANSGSLGGNPAVSGGSWTSSGKRGKAYTFNGGGYIGSTESLEYHTEYHNNFTMMAWVNPTTTTKVDYSQTNSGTGMANSNNNFIFGAVRGTGADPHHYDGGTGAGVSVGTNGIVVGTHAASYMPPLAVFSRSGAVSGWHHVAVVFENKTPKIYLDGVLVATGLQADKEWVFPSNEIGGGSASFGNFKGTLDDVRIIGRALTGREVWTEYYTTNTCNNL